MTFTPHSPRALKAEDLKKQIEAYSDNVVAKPNVNDAVDYAIEHFKDDVIIILELCTVRSKLMNIYKKVFDGKNIGEILYDEPMKITLLSKLEVVVML